MAIGVLRTLDEISKLTAAGASINKCRTQQEAKARFSVLFGLTDLRIGDSKALDNWAKTQDSSIAFDPKGMKNLDQFIKDLVLPPKKIHTEEFRKLLETHHDLQRTSDSLSLQCDGLKSIVESCEDYKAQSGAKRRLNIKISLAKCGLLEKDIAAQQDLCDKFDRETAEQLKIKTTLEDEHQTLTKTLAELRASETSEALKSLSVLLESCDKDIAKCEESTDKLNQIIDTARKYAVNINNLFGSPAVDMAFLDQYGATAVNREKIEPLLKKLLDSFNRAQDSVDDMLHRAQQIKSESYERAKMLRSEIESLEQGLSYTDNRSATALKNAIAVRFKEKGILDEPRFLCELLEINDSSWAQAAEAYMGGYRFSVVVMPNNYIVAAQAYKDLCAQNQSIYNVTLVDSTAFRTEEIAPVEGSLASIFTSANPYAREYVRYAYNNVTLVEDAATPPNKDGTFISKDGMRYARRGFSRMRPVKLAIGAQVRRARLEECYSEELTVKKQYTEAGALERNCLDIKKLGKNNNINALFANGLLLLSESARISDLRLKRMKFDRDIKKLHSSSILQQIKSVEQKAEDTKDKIKSADDDLIKSNAERMRAEQSCTALQEELNTYEDTVSTWRADNPTEFEQAAAELRNARAASRKGGKGFCDWLETQEDTLKSEMLELNSSIKAAQSDYNKRFETAYPTLGYESIDMFLENYRMLSSSQIPEIKSKAEKAALQTRRCFEDDIMSKLRDAIESANTLLTDINRYMGRMAYNGNFYRFAKVEPADGRRDEYDMICSKTNTATSDGQASFDSLAFDNEYSIKRARLFEAIEKGEYSKNGIDLLDYRVYCKFGVIVSNATDESQHGKLGTMVSAGSGAEVQVPCYIILTAALVQKYNRANRLRGSINDSKALRIMIIDECFDKMDTENVQNMIAFISGDMGLQLIASAPTDKFSCVGSTMETIILMKTDKLKKTRDCYYFTAPEFRRLLPDENDEEIEAVDDSVSDSAESSLEALR